MKIHRRSVLALSLAPALAALTSTSATAQASSYPARRVSIIVPFPAGGPADVAARVMQPAMQKALGEVVIVENHGGAGGSIGVGKVLGAPPDGHSILLTTVAEPILPPLTLPSVRYKPEDLRLVSQLSHTEIALFVRPGLPFNTVQEFLAYIRDASNKPLTYATPGSGTLYHLMGEHFKMLLGAQLVHVPYKGLAPAVNDLLGGQVDVAFLPLAGNTAKLRESGKLRAMATSSEKPHGGLPRLGDLPGLKDFAYSVWTGVFLPMQTPQDVVSVVHRAVDAALQAPEFAAYTREVGGQALPRAMTLNQARDMYTSEARRLQTIFQTVKLKVD